MDITAHKVPRGWTNEPKRLKWYFASSGKTAQRHGLETITVILGNTPDTGEMSYIFESGGQFYMGDLMNDYIYEITNPRALPEILEVLTEAEDGDWYKRLRMKKLPLVEWVEEEDDEEEEEEEEEKEEESLFVPVRLLDRGEESQFKSS